MIFLSLRFCPKFCFQILRWNFGFSKQRSVCTFPSTLVHVSYIVKGVFVHSIGFFCYEMSIQRWIVWHSNLMWRYNFCDKIHNNEKKKFRPIFLVWIFFLQLYVTYKVFNLTWLNGVVMIVMGRSIARNTTFRPRFIRSHHHQFYLLE